MDDLHNEAFKESMVQNVTFVVENAVTDRLKVTGLGTGS